MVMNRRFNCEPRGASQRSCVVKGFSPGTTAALRAAANDEGRQVYAATDVQGTDTFRRMKLMTGNRKEIDRKLLQVNRYFSHRLYAVDVEHGIRTLADNL